jgi:hypothetical protein
VKNPKFGSTVPQCLVFSRMHQKLNLNEAQKQKKFTAEVPKVEL